MLARLALACSLTACSLFAFAAQAQVSSLGGPPAMEDSHDADGTELPPVSDIYPQEMDAAFPPSVALMPPDSVPPIDAPMASGRDAHSESAEPWSPEPTAPPPVAVQARPVPVPSLDGLGIYPAAKGETPWRDAQAQAALNALPPQLPASLRPALTQSLAQEWPLAADAAGDGSMLALRAQLLAHWGSVAEAQRLLALASPLQGGESLAWTRAQAAWLAGARADACAQMASGETRFPGNPASRWRMAGLLCRALDGRVAEAQLAIDLMDEQGQTPDPLVRHAVESLRLKKPLADIPTPETWNFIVLAEANGAKGLAANLTRMPVPLLRRIGAEGGFDAGLRKQAAVRLASVDAGVSPGEWLTPVRMEIAPDAPDWQRREAARTAVLLQALGESVDPGLAAGLGVAARPPAPGGSLAGFESAVADRQFRRMMLQLAALVPPNLAEAEDGMLARLVQGLQQAGQRPLARQFAAESIAALGAAARAGKPSAPIVKPASAPVPARAAPMPAPTPKPEPTPKKDAAPPSTSAKPIAAKPIAAKSRPTPPKAAPKPTAAKPSAAPSGLPKINLP